jgi:hypothetical protein
MNAAKERLVKSTQQIFDLYHDCVNVKEVIELMQDQDICSDLVRDIYNQLSTDAEKSTKKRYHYYNSKLSNYSAYSKVDYWTSRYLLIYKAESANSDYHEIAILDLFNDKSL